LLRIRSLIFPILFLTLLLSSFPALASTSIKQLEPAYRHWIEVEVPYIITSEEKKLFLGLASDAERESFIDAFWRVRNPDPNSETNSYKEEHYRRLAYANEHFGNAKYEDGWRTAMGRIYIVLGPPKQRAPYHEKANIRPMEIWFYEANSPALPPYFYILFFKHSAAESWRIYSPTQDGPVALVTTGNSQNDNMMALKFIRNSAGDEVAKTTMTLIPGEAANFDHFEPTMDSDMMLATINGLADNPLTKQGLEANRLREHVTTSIFTGDRSMTISSAVFRDDEGRQTLSYLLAGSAPDPSILGSRPDGSLYYDLTLRTSLLTAAGKPVYEQEDALLGKLSAAQAEVAKKRSFAAEGRLPLAPGTYTLIATLTNNVTHVAARQQTSITVPVVKSQRIGISDVLEYARPAAIPDADNQLPFSASKVRFTPRAAQIVHLRAGEKLPLAFQLWLEPKTADSAAAEKVHLRYVFGAVTASHDAPTTENEDIDAGNRDKAGNLVSGHTVDTSNLPIGTYRLVVTATRDGSQESAHAALTIHIEHSEDYFDRWTAFGAAGQGGVALDDVKRGMSAEAQGSNDEAKGFYLRALAEGAADTRPLDHLAALFERQGQDDELVQLSQQPILSRNAVDPKTLVSISKALTKAGNPKSVVRMLDTQINLQPPSAILYRTLADACEATGNVSRARDLRSRASGVN